MKRNIGIALGAIGLLAMLVALTATTALADGPECEPGQTVVKGHCEKTGTVVGHYIVEQGGCRYVVNYRGDFGDDPYLDNGRIMNLINCKGGSVGSDNPNAGANYNFMIVSEGEPQFDDANIWGTWDFEICTEPGSGNLGEVCAQ